MTHGFKTNLGSLREPTAASRQLSSRCLARMRTSTHSDGLVSEGPGKGLSRGGWPFEVCPFPFIRGMSAEGILRVLIEVWVVQMDRVVLSTRAARVG